MKGTPSPAYNPSPRKKRLIRKPEVLSCTGLSNTTLYDLVKQGLFPSPVRLTTRSVAWKEDEVDQWIAERPVARGEAIA